MYCRLYLSKPVSKYELHISIVYLLYFKQEGMFNFSVWLLTFEVVNIQTTANIW